MHGHDTIPMLWGNMKEHNVKWKIEKLYSRSWCLVKTETNQNGESQNGDTQTATIPYGDRIRGI